MFYILLSELQPIADFEDGKSNNRDEPHDEEVNPKTEVVVDKWYRGVHRHHVGIGSEGEEDSRKYGEHLHGLVEFVRKEGIVGIFECLDGFFLTLKEVPETDIGPDEVLIVDGKLVRDMRMITLDEGFDDSALGFEGPAEIQDIALQDRDFQHHFFLLSRKHLHLDKVELFGDVVKLGEARIEENFQDMVEEPSWTTFEVEATLTLALFEEVKETRELVDGVTMTGDEVFLGEDDIEFTRIGGSELGIKEGNVDGKKQTTVVLDDLGLIGRGDQLLDGEGMDIEVLLEVRDVIRTRVLEIKPR